LILFQKRLLLLSLRVALDPNIDGLHLMRDTDADWVRISESEPYYAVLTAPKFLRENLDENIREEFFRSGAHDIDHVVALIRAHVKPDFAPKRALDFGSGVGRLAIPMAAFADTVIGVDVSPTMLFEARRNKQERAPNKDISFYDHIPNISVEWVSSLLVLQHIPPAVGMTILKDLLNKLVIGGVASLQFTAYRELSHLDEAFSESRYLRFDGQRLDVIEEKIGPEVRMAMYDYDMTSVLAAYASAGVRQMWVEHVNHNGHHAFWVFGQRT
jgi:SAM-dependent methyltransferase